MDTSTSRSITYMVLHGYPQLITTLWMSRKAVNTSPTLGRSILHTSMCVMYIYIGHNPGLTDSTGHCTEEREAKRATEIHFVSSRDGNRGKVPEVCKWWWWGEYRIIYEWEYECETE